MASSGGEGRSTREHGKKSHKYKSKEDTFYSAVRRLLLAGVPPPPSARHPYATSAFSSSIWHLLSPSSAIGLMALWCIHFWLHPLSPPLQMQAQPVHHICMRGRVRNFKFIHAKYIEIYKIVICYQFVGTKRSLFNGISHNITQ
jgi:hypothetical protein